MATVFAMTLLYRRTQERWEARTDEDGRTEAARLVDVAKAWITWRAREVIVESRERCGAQALLENNGMTELVTGVEGAITAEGDNIALYTKAAADMLFAAEPRGDGGGPDRLGHPGDLSDPRFLRRLLASVQEIWFARARERAMRAPEAADALGRWNAASGPALRGVEAFAYRQAAEAYAEARAALPEGAARDRLGELERLFATEWVARNSGDLLAAGLLSGDQVDELAETGEELIAAVAAHARELADSFALPEALLADWPIAGPGYADAYDDPQGPWTAPRRTPDERRARGADRVRPAGGAPGGPGPAYRPAGLLGHDVRARPPVREAAAGRRRIGSPQALTRRRPAGHGGGDGPRSRRRTA